MEKYRKSNEMLERALKVTPLGAQTFSKSSRYYIEGNAPSFIDRGEKCYVWDVDGNKFTDFICALGPITVGYNNKEVNDAIIEQLNKGIIFSTQSEIELKLAEKIIEIIPCAEMVRFVKNGGDATTAAVRLARAYTGKDRIAMCGYHGMHDWSIGASANRMGVPPAVCELTDNFTYNDLDSLEKLLISNKDKVAAVIMEPIQSDGPKEGYLERVKEITHKYGALLIFDEVVSGFRYALGGAAELYGVVPDIVAFGKGIANGMPLSAVAGKRDIMKLIEKGVFISTTFGGECLSMAAAYATIKLLEEKDTYKNIWLLGEKMKSGISRLIQKYDIGNVVAVSGLAPHCGVSFNGYGSLSYLDINSIYSSYMIDNGMLVLAINNINKSHSSGDIDDYLAATEKAFFQIARAVNQNSLKGILDKGRIDPIFKRNIK